MSWFVTLNLGLRKGFFLFAVAGALCLPQAQALIFYNASNSSNLTDPGDGFQFDAVARISSAQNPTSLGQINGSAIHLGGGYMLTANHVGTSTGNEVTFDGSTFYQIDGSFTPTQVAANVDMKVFKLNANPGGISAVDIYTGSSENIGNAYLVGWGVGRDATALGSSSVGWGGHTTSDKRWGINRPEDFINVPYQSGSYTAIRTTLGSPSGTPSGIGDLETAVTDKDSGSAMFQYLDGSWQLIGVATAVETSGTSLFGDDVPSSANSHDNFFARVAPYSSDILILIPELHSLSLMGIFGMGFLVCVSRRK